MGRKQSWRQLLHYAVDIRSVEPVRINRLLDIVLFVSKFISILDNFTAMATFLALGF